MSYIPAEKDITLIRNVDFVDPLQILDQYGNPIDLTNCSLTGTVIDNYDDRNLVCSISGSVTVPVSGMFSLICLKATTGAIPTVENDDYISTRDTNLGVWDLKLYNANTGYTDQLLYGNVKLARDTSP